MANNFYAPQQKLGRTQAKKLMKAELQKEKDKEAAEQRKKDQEADKLAAQVKKSNEQKERKEARTNIPSKFPDFFNNQSAQALIDMIDFSQAEYVETGPSESGTITRRAFFHYVYNDRESDENASFDYDCWVGANAHPPKDSNSDWTPGNSYILEYHGFQVKTSAANVQVISKLPASKGTKPSIL
jgi:hypothetical protein